jgi:hemerythrin-like domain-containing protein
MDILDAQVSLFHRGKSPDYNLMLDIMHYMMKYPDIAHHTVEEIIFEKLSKLRPQLKKQAEIITAQHQELARHARHFSDDLQAIVDGNTIMSRDQIEQQASYYITLLREHLRQEEADLLSAAEQELSDKDFKEIENSMPDLGDPLANPQLLKDYETLYKHITNEE